MTRSKAWLAGIAICVAAMIAGLVVASQMLKPSTGGTAERFFEQTFNDLDGRPAAMSQWQGQFVVVNFWATWCAPCIEEMPDMQAIHNEYAPRGVVVVGLGIDSPSALRGFRDQHGLTLPLFAAGAAGSDTGRSLGNSAGALPYTVLINPDGRIVQARLGRVHQSELRRWLDAEVPKSGSGRS